MPLIRSEGKRLWLGWTPLGLMWSGLSHVTCWLDTLSSRLPPPRVTSTDCQPKKLGFSTQRPQQSQHPQQQLLKTYLWLAGDVIVCRCLWVTDPTGIPTHLLYRPSTISQTIRVSWRCGCCECCVGVCHLLVRLMFVASFLHRWATALNMSSLALPSPMHSTKSRSAVCEELRMVLTIAPLNSIITSKFTRKGERVKGRLPCSYFVV